MYNRPRSALGVQTQRHPVSTGRPRQRTAEEGGGREEVYLSRVWDKAASQELAQLLDMRGYEAEAVVGSQRRAYPQVRSRPTTASSARKRGRDAKLSLFTSSNGFMGGSTFSPSSSPNRNRPQSSIQVGRRRGRGGGPASPHHDHRFEDSDQQPWNVHNFRNVLSAAPASSADARQLAETLTNELTKVFPRSKGGRLSSECFTRKDKLEALRNAYGSCMKELVRQLKVRSTPQGELLETIWKNYVSMLEEIVMHSQVKRDIENWSLWEKRNGGTKPPQQPLKSIQGLKVAPKVLASPSVGATLDKGRVLTSKVRPKMRRSSTTGSSFKAGAGSLLAKLNGVSNSKPGTPAPAISAAANRFRLLASMGGGLRSSASAQLSSGVVSRDLLNAAKVALDQIESIKKLREMTFIEESKKANKRQGGLRIPVKGDPKHKQKQLANYWRRKLSMGLAKPTKILAGGPHKMRRTRTLQDAAITIQACWRMSEAKAEVDARRRAELKNLTRASFLSQMQATVRCIEEEREKERIRAERSNELNKPVKFQPDRLTSAEVCDIMQELAWESKRFVRDAVTVRWERKKADKGDIEFQAARTKRYERTRDALFEVTRSLLDLVHLEVGQGLLSDAHPLADANTHGVAKKLDELRRNFHSSGHFVGHFRRHDTFTGSSLPGAALQGGLGARAKAAKPKVSMVEVAEQCATLAAELIEVRGANPARTTDIGVQVSLAR